MFSLSMRDVKTLEMNAVALSVGRMHPLVVDENRIVYYRHGKICSRNLETGKTSRICTLDLPAYKKACSYVRIVERTLRLEPRCAARVEDEGFVFSYSGAIYHVNEALRECRVEHRYREGMSNVLRFALIRGVRGFDDAVAYGEYWQNPEREPVRVFTRKDGVWSPVYTFSGKTVKHIHGLIPDPVRGCVYIVTGDEDSESGIWVARDNFREVAPLLTGKKEYRACVGIADENGLLYATDNPYETNYIRFVGLSGNGSVTGVRDVMEINGPCIYGTEWNGKLVLSTSVEQDYTIKRNRLFSILNRKLGGGTKSAHAVVYVGNLRTGFSELVRYRKDIWPMGLCALGTVQFPLETNRKLLCFYPVSVKQYDGCTMIVKG